MLQVPEAASQTWKLMPFKTTEEAPLNVKVQVVEVLPAELPSVSLRDVSWAAKAFKGSRYDTTKNKATVKAANRLRYILVCVLTIFWTNLYLSSKLA